MKGVYGNQGKFFQNIMHWKNTLKKDVATCLKGWRGIGGGGGNDGSDEKKVS